MWTSAIVKSHVKDHHNPKLSKRLFVPKVAMGVALGALRKSDCLANFRRTTLLDKMDRQDPESSKKRTSVLLSVT